MSELYNKTLQRLVKYRHIQQMTQIDMGNWFGITQSHYSKMELGRIEIPYKFLCKLYAGNWDIDYLVTGIYNGAQEHMLDGLFRSCREQDRYELMKLALWLIDQVIDRSKDHTSVLERRILHMLLEGGPVSSVMYLIRNVIDFSQVIMAERLGLGMKKYRRMEKGDTQPDLELLTIVYHLSGCRPSLFLGSEEGAFVILKSLWNCIDKDFQYHLLPFLEFGRTIIEIENESSNSRCVDVK
ncbi:MAG: hypothetical protein HFI75_00140 [Lachnospiraceae bacterium]|nr:hypothetical protein [Lachnospiraceae bacterium]